MAKANAQTSSNKQEENNTVVTANSINLEKVKKILASFDRGRNDGAVEAGKWLQDEKNAEALQGIDVDYFAASSLYEAARNKGLSDYLLYAGDLALCLYHRKILSSGGAIETPYDGFMESLRQNFDLHVAFEGSKIVVFVPEGGLTKDIAAAIKTGASEHDLTLTKRSRMGKLPDKIGSFVVFELIVPQNDPFADLLSDDDETNDD